VVANFDYFRVHMRPSLDCLLQKATLASITGLRDVFAQTGQSHDFGTTQQRPGAAHCGEYCQAPELLRKD
jgi:hypothetical protein